MGKWTDKLYITRTECESGDHFGARGHSTKTNEVETPSIDLCSLSLLPWDKPVCTLDGAVYDHLNALEANICSDSLVELNFGPAWSCPVTCKDLRGRGVRVVAVRSSGWVYEAGVVEEVCRNGPPDTWRDPMTDLPFTRADIIHLQPRKPLQKPKETFTDYRPSNQVNTTVALTSYPSKYDNSIQHQIGIGRVTLRLNVGDLHFELDCQKEPLACQSFLQAALEGAFLQAPIYRILNGPSGGLVQAGRSDQLQVLCKSRPSEAGTHNQKGLLGLVALKPGRYAPHLYVTLAPTPALDGVNVVLGRVVAGWKVLEKLADVPVKIDTCMPAVDCFIEDVIVVDNPFQQQ